MRDYRKTLGSVLAFLTLLSLFVWAAWAQEDAGGGSCCGTALVQKASGVCPDSGICPVTGACSALASGLSGVAIYLDSPAVLLAKADTLTLTAEQQSTIQAIEGRARFQALNALTKDQKGILGAIPAEPVVLGAAKTKACETGYTKPCCEQAESASLAQTLCPVMNAPIRKTLFVDYQGKKVYFCCPGCQGLFTKKPEKNLPELPQFNI